MQQVIALNRDEEKAQKNVRDIVKLVEYANEFLVNPISAIEIHTDVKNIYSGMKIVPIIGKRNTTTLVLELNMKEKERMYFLQHITERAEVVAIADEGNDTIKLEWWSIK